MSPQSIHAFAEKVALVINGGDGVGRATALQLALQGCFVIVSFSGDKPENKSVTDELTSLGTLAKAVEFTTARDLIDEVDKLYGRLDLLVNCPETGVDAVLQIETITTESIRLMRDRPKPAIVNVFKLSDGAEQAKRRAEILPKNFRVNYVVESSEPVVERFEFFESSRDDDTARVITFLLSSEAKALNGQIMHIS